MKRSSLTFKEAVDEESLYVVSLLFMIFSRPLILRLFYKMAAKMIFQLTRVSLHHGVTCFDPESLFGDIQN